MLDRNRYDLFVAAGPLLAHYQSRHPGFHAREVALALVIQHYQAQIPVVGSGTGIDLDQLVLLCDQLYHKRHSQLGEKAIWPPFSHDAQGFPRSVPAQDPHWYKASNGQQGLGCHAQAVHFWHNPTFLAEDRDLCPFRVYDGVTALTLDQGRQQCGFDGNPCGWLPGLPKFLQVLGRNHQAQVLRAVANLGMWQTLVPEPIPLFPLLIQLYFAQPELSPTVQVLTPELFFQEFHLEGLSILFSTDPQQPENRELLRLARLPAQPAPRLHHPQEPSSTRPRPTGGHLVLDPEELPRYQRSGLPAGLSQDPLLAERRRRRQLERTKAHDLVLKNFRRWFRLAGKEVREDPDTFDFLAIDDQLVLLAEIKCLGQQDTAEAIQEVVGQLAYYEYFALAPWRQAGFPIVRAAVFDHPPLADYLTFLAQLDINCYWLDEQGRIDGSAPSLTLLEKLGIAVRLDPELVS
ncbi:hypothetical protein [Candidatus Cyanaurora vandensis]|uniref:hypothetical protein n=1 Tax=Candidatus Cyanaurora vandensis TaxID=2714958 RepID=UPI00257AFC1F|nr:hypothetical protein [Candidatus Cyanaurora vandensis]